MMVIPDGALLQVEHLKKYFPIKAGLLKKTVGYIKAVDDVSFFVKEGETLGLVGESGCGKSTTGYSILRLEKATAGQVYFNGQEILSLNKKSMRGMRKEIQIIFQDPYASLNPRMTVEEIVGEVLDAHRLVKKKEERRERVVELLNSVGLDKRYLQRFPHEFSGGQRQRIGIARALAVNPKMIIADEPVSALDVSVQAQVINLLRELQRKFGLTYIIIAHDLSVVKHISDRVAVMYLGKIVEMSDKRGLYARSLHPYTKALLSAIPIPDPTYKKERIILQGDVPSPANPPVGCRFYPRCQKANKICREVEPDLLEYEDQHYVACHLVS